MKRKKISPTRPRVYLMDFEVSVQFPQGYEERQCFVSGLPVGGSFTEAETYCRSKAPECLTGELYSPFKLDIWQLGISLEKFRVRHTQRGMFHIVLILEPHADWNHFNR